MSKEPIDRRADVPPHMYGEGQTKQGDIKSVRAEVISTADDTVNLAEPSSPTHPEYPYNKVEHTLSGHLFEVDDTPGAERILEMHKSGTFVEVHPDGKRVTKIFGDDFYIVLDDHNLVVGGNLNITVQGNANFLVKGNAKTKVNGNYDLTVHGNMTTRVRGKRMDYTKGNHTVQTKSNLSVRSEAKTDIHAKGDLNIQTSAKAVFKSASDTTHYVGGTYRLSIASAFNMRSSTLNMNASGQVYIDGSRVDINKPGPGVSITNPASNDPKDQDPGAGLTVEDSVIEPTFDVMKVIRTDNPALGSVVPKNTKYPKDRKKQD